MTMIHCPPCRSPARCLGLNGECGLNVDKREALREQYEADWEEARKNHLATELERVARRIIEGQHSLTNEQHRAINSLMLQDEPHR